MDETQQSRASDVATTRKRRSSILKSQRPPRAPLSELEFNVATPTDTAKSRRVSFSKRTGVAEFITNEATTTWKNFYEEHNKSLESSGNDSAAIPRASVGHIGKRIFEDQFQEVEVIDFGSPVNNSNGVEISSNNANFDQIALECTAGNKYFSASGQNFEFSTFTVFEPPSKVFGDDLAITGLGEISDKINVNFSTMEPVGDDLDEIQKDLERHQANPQNIIGTGPPSGRNISGYIEVDLNASHVALASEVGSLSDDMSITDTIHSLKLNDSKNNEKSLDKDWVTDKENIAMNPYVAPKESATFAINEASDKVLVFDGKRITFQSHQEPIIDYRKTLIPSNELEQTPQRKTIVLNVDDDLPNFLTNSHVSLPQVLKDSNSYETQIGNNSDMSVTQPVLANHENNSDKRHTIVFEESSGDISMTQALPSNIASGKHEKHITIMYDDDKGDISITQAVPANVIIPKQNAETFEVESETRKTIVFDDVAGNISMTQALPINILEKSQPVTFEREVNICETFTENETLVNPLVNSRRRHTLVFNDEDGNISITKVIPSNILLSQEEKHTIYKISERTNATLSRLPSSLETDSTVAKNKDINVSTTEVTLSNILSQEEDQAVHKVLENTNATLSKLTSGLETESIVNSNISVLKEVKQLEKMSIQEIGQQTISILEPEKRKTIVFNDEDGNISVTRSIPSNILLSDNSKHYVEVPSEETSDVQCSSPSTVDSMKRKTIVFDDEDGDISLTKTIQTNFIISDMAKSETGNRNVTVVRKHDESICPNNHSSNVNLEENYGYPIQMKFADKQPTRSSLRPKITIAYEELDVSVTQTLPTNIILPEERNTVGFDGDLSNISTSPSVKRNQILPKINKKTSNVSPEKKPGKKIIKENLSPTKKKPGKTNIKHKSPPCDNVQQDTIQMARLLKQFKANTESSPTALGAQILEKLDIDGHDVYIMASVEIEKLENYSENVPATNFENLTEDTQYHHLARNIDENNRKIRRNVAKIPKDVTIYQNTNVTCAGKQNLKQKSPLSTVSSSNGKGKAAMELVTTDHENMINAKYVTVSHRLPMIPSKIDSEMNVEFEKPKLPLDSTIESGSTSSQDLNLNSSPVCAESKYMKSEILGNDLLQSHSFINNTNNIDDILEIDTLSGSGIVDKSITVNMSGTNVTKLRPKSMANSVSDELFYIIQNNDFETQTYKSNANKKSKTLVNHVKKNTCQKPEVKNRSLVKRNDKNLGDKYYSVHQQEVLTSKKDASPPKRKNLKDADSTRDLLDLLSKFTEKEEEDNPILPMTNKDKVDTAPEQTFPKRPSMAFSREDLMNNISMAQAMLRNSVCIETEAADGDFTLLAKKKDRLSSEVVKTLRFADDESSIASKDNISTIVTTPLKKTAFGETSYMSEEHKKGHVIPTYLKDVSDGIKALMTDLVKPMTDVMPFTSGEKVDKTGIIQKPSNYSDTVQTNLISSSQIDLTPKTSMYEHLRGIIKPYEERFRNSSSTSPSESDAVSIAITSKISSQMNNRDSMYAPIHQTTPGIVEFDPENPLNNVLIAPFDFHNVHKYAPVGKLQDNDSPVNRGATVSFKDADPEGDEYVQYHVHGVVPEFLESSFNNLSLRRTSDQQSVTSKINNQKLMMDQSVETIKKSIKEEGINTIIALHDTKRLLEDIPLDLKILENDNASTLTGSPVEVVSSIQSSPSIKSVEKDEVRKNKKRSDKRKHKKCTLTTQDATPRPAAKISKRSLSSDSDVLEQCSNIDKKGSGEGRGSSRPNSSLLLNYNVHSTFNMESSRDLEPRMNVIKQLHTKETARLAEKGSELATTAEDAWPGSASEDAEDIHSLVRSGAGAEWEPELLHEPSSAALLVAHNPAADVARALHHLPFLADAADSRKSECAWEYAREDEWSFRLLRGRVRLAVRLAGAWPAVLATTPIAHIRVHIAEPVVDLNEKNASSTLCVQFAAEAMRRVCARAGAEAEGALCAGAVPGALRRCAGVARVAARWARAMHAAWTHLGYELASDGVLKLKVVNNALCCVWDVTMRLEMVAEDSAQVAWPRAGMVRVRGAGGVDVARRALARLAADLPHDWGHAPRALWKVFRHLKNMSVQDLLQ